VLETAISEAPVQDLEGEGPRWLEALPARKYNTPFYGEVVISPEKLDRMIQNFKNGVRGQDIAIDFEHGMDSAKGKKAAGWYKDFTLRPSSKDPKQLSLWALVDFTEEAKKEVKDKQWRYFSLEWDDKWKNNDGVEIEDVIIGGALTNRPVAKETMPINFSENMWDELTDSEKKHFAVTALDRMVGESKEWEHSSPGTGSPPEPRTDEDGSDEPDITGGWRRQTPPVDPAEQPENPVVQYAKGGKTSVSGVEFNFAEKDARELFKVLDLDSDVKPEKVVETIKVKFGELDALRDAVSAADQEKVFAEQYPQYWEEHRKLMERDRDNSAKAFAETVAKVRKTEGYGLKETKQGLSVESLAKIQEVHKKFAEGTVTSEDFEECIKTIVNGGIVQFGELGSNATDDDIPEIDTNSATGVAAARKLFAEVVAKTQRENEGMDYNKALAEAAKKHPDLAEAYMVTLPA
jgi:hypothetical protein